MAASLCKLKKHVRCSKLKLNLFFILLISITKEGCARRNVINWANVDDHKKISRDTAVRVSAYYPHVLSGIIRVLSLCQGRVQVTGVEQIIK